MTKTEVEKKTRRGFINAGLAAAAGVAGLEYARRNELQQAFLGTNEKVARAYFSPKRLAKEFPTNQAAEPRPNGSHGLESDIDLNVWGVDLDGIHRLPKIEMVTELCCIEGWSQVVKWGGARFADYTAKYAPKRTKYVGLATPDEEYFVGLDIESAMHSQTLLCYEMNGSPLTSEHGAPLRLVIPVKYGIKNIKRIGTIRYSDERPQDFWAERGYSWYAGL